MGTCDDNLEPHQPTLNLDAGLEHMDSLPARRGTKDRRGWWASLMYIAAGLMVNGRWVNGRWRTTFHPCPRGLSGRPR